MGIKSLQQILPSPGVKSGMDLLLDQGLKVILGHLCVDLVQDWTGTDLPLEVEESGIFVSEVNLQIPLFSEPMVPSWP